MPIITITEYKFPDGERRSKIILVDQPALDAWEALKKHGCSIGYEDNGHVVYADVVVDATDDMIANTIFIFSTKAYFSERVSKMLVKALEIYSERYD